MAEDIKIDGYSYGVAPTSPPDAACFDRGAKSLVDVQKAVDARRAHSDKTTKEAARNDHRATQTKNG